MNSTTRMSAQLVTVATFTTPIEAHTARNQLEMFGIRAFLADEATVGMAPHLSPAMGGVKLRVPESDVERALSVLEFDKPPLTEDDWEPDEAGEVHDAAMNDREEPLTTPWYPTVSGVLFITFALVLIAVSVLLVAAIAF